MFLWSVERRLQAPRSISGGQQQRATAHPTFAQRCGFLGGNDTTLRPPRCCSSRRASQIASRSYPYFAAWRWRTRRTSSTTGSFHMVSFSHQFLGRADDWDTVAVLVSNRRHDVSNRGVGDVLAVPGEEVVHAMDGCQSDVKRVFVRLLR